jgi:hypothetical protein
MKKTNLVLWSLILMCGVQANSHAQTMKQPQNRKITLSRYLFNSVEKILNMENLDECLGRSLEIRFLTSDCNAFLYELESETSETHANAQAAYLNMKHETARSKATLYLDLYTDMISMINILKSRHQNDIDKQSVAYSIRQQVLNTKKKMIELSKIKN